LLYLEIWKALYLARGQKCTALFVLCVIFNSHLYHIVAKIFKVSFNNVDFIRQMTGLTSLRVLVAERRSRFFSKLHQLTLFRSLMPLFYNRIF